MPTLDTLAGVEAALDGRRLFIKMRNGNAWLCRRNGKTKLWKTRPGEFRIPLKMGFRGHAEITHADLACFSTCFEVHD